MEFIENFKLGALEGISALVVLGTVALVVIVALIVLLVNGIKAVKERKDAKETDAEDAFFAEYGVTGEEVRLNEQLAAKRERLARKRRTPDVKWKVIETVKEVEGSGGETTHTVEYIPEEKHDFVPYSRVYDDETVYNIPPNIFDDKEIHSMNNMTIIDDDDLDTAILPEIADEDQEIYYLEEYVEPVPEEVKQPEPVAAPQPKVEAAPVEKSEPVQFVERDPLYPLPINEYLINERYYSDPTAVAVDNREENWARYNGNFAGFYYDPYDACYHEGYAPLSLVNKLVQKQEEYNETHPDKGKRFIVKRIDPPYMPLKTPKNERAELTPEEGFDPAAIFGKYVIEHIANEDKDEWFYTLYDPKGEKLYESDNYSTLDYCKRGIMRFRAHVKTGQFSVNSAEGKYYYVLTKKQYTHKGIALEVFEDVTAQIKSVKKYYGTTVVKEI